MDALIVVDLGLYAALLAALVALPQGRRWAVLLPAALAMRAFALCLRQNLGTDVENYVNVLTTCDLGSINALEIFWYPACLPSSLTAGILPFPFLWIGLLDCAIFLWMARLGGIRIAALHDLVYLPTQELGAIRQALAMKLIVIAVLLYLRRRGDVRRNRPLNLLAGAAFVHLAAIVPFALVRFSTASLRMRIVMLAGATALALAAASMLDATLIDKLRFYLEFEGFRSSSEIYASWAKRIVVITASMTLIAAPRLTWALYAIGLAFAACETVAAEIAVRIGAYFEQFEIFLIGSPMRAERRQAASLWYGLLGTAYAARFALNVFSLPR
jgi:hypothetical protein